MQTNSDGMLWARVDYKELVNEKSSFQNCSKEKPSAPCSVSDLWHVRCVFADLRIDERVKEQKCYGAFYSFITLLSVFLREQKLTLLEPFLVYV